MLMVLTGLASHAGEGKKYELPLKTPAWEAITGHARMTISIREQKELMR